MKPTTCTNYSDEQLIEQYLLGNKNALSELYNSYYSKVYQKCLSFTKNSDDAFDLAQDILMKAFSKIGTFKGNSKFSTWLFSITHNYCITAVSKNKAMLFDEISFEQSIADDSITEEEFAQRVERENQELKLKTILDEIPALDKELLNLKYMHNYSIKQLQAKYELSASAVKMRLMRARQKVELYFYHPIV